MKAARIGCAWKWNKTTHLSVLERIVHLFSCEETRDLCQQCADALFITYKHIPSWAPANRLKELTASITRLRVGMVALASSTSSNFSGTPVTSWTISSSSKAYVVSLPVSASAQRKASKLESATTLFCGHVAFLASACDCLFHLFIGIEYFSSFSFSQFLSDTEQIDDRVKVGQASDVRAMCGDAENKDCESRPSENYAEKTISAACRTRRNNESSCRP